MDHNPTPPSAIPVPPWEHLQNPPNAATTAPKPGPGNSTTLNQDEEEEEPGGGADDQKNLPMKNFRTLLFTFIKPLTPSEESLIEQRLRDFFPAISSVPDHPPYAEMIRRAIEKLNKQGGSSEEAISEFIKDEYNHLPWAHPTLLAHHLRKLSERGELVITCDRCYILRSAIINTTSNPRPIRSPRPHPRPRPDLIPKYSPCYTAFSSPSSSPIPSPFSSPSYSPCSSPSSSSSDPPTPKRRLNQRIGRGRPREWIQEWGRGSPHQVDESDEKFMLNGKRRQEIQKRGRGRPCKSGQGRGRGRPRKKAENEEKQTDVAEDRRMTKDENQPVGLEVALEEHSQVADMQVEEIKRKTVVRGQECQVILVRNREEEQSITIGIEAQGQGAAEEWENHQKQENRITEVQIALEEQRNGLEDCNSRLREVDESDEKFKLNGRRRGEIQKRGRGRPRKSGQGRGRGGPCKKAETEEGYQPTKEEQTDVAEDHQMTKDENQPVGLEAALEEHSQVADVQVEEIKGKNLVGQDCQVTLVQNREEEQSSTNGIEAQGRGAAEEWENHLKEENRITEVQIALEERRNGLEENKKPEEQIEDIIDQNPLWKQEDRVIQDQQEGSDMYRTDQQDVVMIRSEARGDGFFEEWSGKQKQEKGTISEQTQSEDHEVIEGQNESTEQHAEVISLQAEQRKMGFEVAERQYLEEKQENGVVQEEVQLEGDVSQGRCLQEEQQNEVVYEEVQLEFEVAEGQCQKEELKSELVQVEVQTEYKVVEGLDTGKDPQSEVVLEEFQLDDKVVEEKQNALMNISEQQRDVDVEKWIEKELGESGSLKQNQSEAQENDAFQELVLPQKRHMDGIIENVQQCKQQEKEKLEQDQLHNQKVEVPEELHQREGHPVEMFQEEIQLEEEVLAEQRDMVMIRSEAVEDGVVERSTGQVKQVKGDTVDQNEWTDQQDDAIGEQVQAQEIFMVGIREKFQSCKQEEIEEQNHLAKPEAEVPERLHEQDEQPNEECSIDGTFEEQEDLGTILSEAEEGSSTEEWSEEQKNEKGVRAEVNQSEEHENVSKEQTQARGHGIAGNKEKLQACELQEIITMELKDREEQVNNRKQHQEEELQVEAFEKRSQLQEKVNVARSARLQSIDASGIESTALLCKYFWSLVEEERDEYLDRFRDKKMKSPCQKGEIPNSSSKWAQKQPEEIPLLESSTKCNQPLQDRVQDEPLHPQFQLSRSEPATTASVAEILLSENRQLDDDGKGRSPELKVCAPCVEGIRLHCRIAKAVATSENQHGKGQPLRRSPRNLTADLEAAVKIEDLKHLKHQVKHPGGRTLPMPNFAATDKVLRSGKRIKKAGV